MSEPNVREFIARVLPWPVEDQGSYTGYVNIHWTVPGKNGKKPFWLGKPTQTVNGFFNTLTWVRALENTRDIYFCTSLQSQTTTTKKGKEAALRLAANAIAMKAIWLDLDVVTPGKVKDGKQEYDTLEAAIRAVLAFSKDIGLREPTALVGSGGGLHAYWMARQPMVPDCWQSWADRLASAARDKGLLCDLGCTTDRARILRVPGTANFKTDPPRPTRLLHLAPEDMALE